MADSGTTGSRTSNIVKNIPVSHLCFPLHVIFFWDQVLLAANFIPSCSHPHNLPLRKMEAYVTQLQGEKLQIKICWGHFTRSGPSHWHDGECCSQLLSFYWSDVQFDGCWERWKRSGEAVLSNHGL